MRDHAPKMSPFFLTKRSQ